MNLSKPDRKLKKRIREETGFHDRFIGYRLHKRMGPIPVTVYSLRELAILLNDPQPRIDFLSLKNWVNDVLTDLEMGSAIDAILKSDESDLQKTARVKHLVTTRLSQCKIFR